MKKYSIAIIGVLASMMFTGCEMKNELLGDDTSKTVNGKVELGVSVKQPLSSSSRADSEASVSTDDFPVTIIDANGKVVKDYERADQIPASFLLPVGTYTVTSHTKGDVSKNMSSAYYHGSQTLEVVKGVTTSANVICKMKNSRINVTYGDDFLAGFQSWTIVINDGSSQVITYKETNKTPSPVYWLFDEGKVTSIRVDITAVTTTGNTISDSRTFRKADASENYSDVNDYFEGGDALAISMGAVAASNGYISGITVKTDVTFENYDQSVEIPVNNVETPLTVAEPEGNSYIANGIKITDSSYPTNVGLNYTSTKGIQSVYVKLTSDNADLTTWATNAGMTSGDGLNLSTLTSSSYFTLPTASALTYNFAIKNAFMEVLQQYAGSHKLVVKLYDVNNNTLTRGFDITVTKNATTPVADPSVKFQENAAKVTYISANEISYSKSDTPSQFDAYLAATKGFKSILVTIEPGNTEFDTLLKDLDASMDFTGAGVDIVDNDVFTTAILGGSGVKSGDTSFTFEIGKFFVMLNVAGTTDAGKAHVFNIKITDKEGQTTTSALKIHILE